MSQQQQFYQLWRNLFIKKNIRKQLLSHLTSFEITLAYFKRYHSNIPSDVLDVTLCIKENDLNSFIQSKQSNPLLFDKVKGIYFYGLWRRGLTLPVDLLVNLKSLNYVGFDISFQSEIENGFIPEGVKTVCYERGVDSDLVPGFFPSSLTHLRAESSITSGAIQDDSLPQSLASLELGEYFEGDLNDQTLPRNLVSLDLGTSYYGDITKDTIPDTVTNLSFCGVVDEDYCFPPKLTTLKITCLNMPLAYGMFPNTLTSLEFIDIMFDEPLALGILPESLKSLHLGTYDLELVPGSLPQHLETLSLGYYENPLFEGLLPPSLTSLDLGKSNHPIDIGILPSKLTQLRLPEIYDHPIEAGVIPHGVKKLYFNHSEDKPCQGCIPNTVTQLSFSSNFQSELVSGIIPDSVTKLKFKCPYYIHPLKTGVIPRSVKHLTLSLEEDIGTVMVPDETIPHSVEHLKITCDIPLEANVIPNSVKTLILDRAKSIQNNAIPTSVTHLTIGRCQLPSGIPKYIKTLVIGNINYNITIPAALQNLIIPNGIKDFSYLTIPQSIASLKHKGVFELNGESS